MKIGKGPSLLAVSFMILLLKDQLKRKPGKDIQFDLKWNNGGAKEYIPRLRIRL